MGIGRPKIPTVRRTLLSMHASLLETERHRWDISFDERLSTFEEMVLLLEDRRFFKHFGVDFKSILREVWRFFARPTNGGASTIDMQLFRTISDRYERTARRKIREILGATLLQKRLSKLQILRIYLQVAYFGTGLHGAQEGANALFGEDGRDVDLKTLTNDQAAKLATLLVYPKPSIRSVNWEANVRRRQKYALALFATHEEKLKKIETR